MLKPTKIWPEQMIQAIAFANLYDNPCSQVLFLPLLQVLAIGVDWRSCSGLGAYINYVMGCSLFGGILAMVECHSEWVNRFHTASGCESSDEY